MFINDIDSDLSNETLASLFADDTSIATQKADLLGENRTLMQNEIHHILAWAQKWKMTA